MINFKNRICIIQNSFRLRQYIDLGNFKTFVFFNKKHQNIYYI
jgi:hypothetical protein